MGFIYIGHPASQYGGDPAALVDQCAKSTPEHGGAVVRARAYAADASLNARDFCSTVLQTPGPVLLLRPVQRDVIEEVRLRLGTRVPVSIDSASCIEDLRALIVEAVRKFDAGEPLVPLDVVVALLMMRKLDREHMWTGNAKGYMWASDIPKGRGLDEKYAPRVPNVLNVLLMQGLLVFKTSNSKKKYALKPDRREDIYEILRARRLPESAERPLLRHEAAENVRALDLLTEYDRPDE
jgi:hypothetical protein